MMEEFLNPEFISKVGFPIIMVGVLYFDFRKILKKNTEAIVELCQKIDLHMNGK